ncbi:MAG: GTP-binding protein [Promethearchaeota archaeon]|nr:MAG: GTP-binding protein [Candidatus Lokiarchaeota archaeon]
MNEYKFKLCIIGDGGAGKTSLTRRYLEGVFKNDWKMTIGVDFYLKKLDIDAQSVSLQVWDFAGEEKFRFLLPGVILGADGTIFMYDITRNTTFKNLDNWLEVFNQTNKEHGQEVSKILVGSKTDLKENRVVSKDDAIKYTADKGFLNYFECSSKNGENVEQIFNTMAKIMLKNRLVLEKSGK